MIDVVVGLMMIIAVGLMLARVAGQQQTAATHLADQRSAVRLAEQTILECNSTSPTTRPALAPNITLRPTDATSAAPTGMRWVAVTATVNGRSATLVALVPADAEGLR